MQVSCVCTFLSVWVCDLGSVTLTMHVVELLMVGVSACEREYVFIYIHFCCILSMLCVHLCVFVHSVSDRTNTCGETQTRVSPFS